MPGWFHLRQGSPHRTGILCCRNRSMLPFCGLAQVCAPVALGLEETWGISTGLWAGSGSKSLGTGAVPMGGEEGLQAL